MGRLNPYVWGGDSVRDVAKTIRLHASGKSEDRAEAEKITRDSEERFNAKKRR